MVSGAIKMTDSRRGFTLIELIIVMAMFLIVVLAATSSFNVLITQMSKLTKSEESNIEGVVGLEMIRHDLQQSGFALPYAFIYPDTPPNYVEATVDPAKDYNDAPNGVPRAVVAGDNVVVGVPVADAGVNYQILANTDYLALKGVTLGFNDASQRWTYMQLDNGIAGVLKPRIWPTENLGPGDRVIVMKKSFTGTKMLNQLVYNSGTPGIYWANYDANGFADPAFAPTLREEIYYIYGIRNGGQLGMPFNRADYFVATPSDANRVPGFCAPNTGILYKGTINHNGGGLQPIPLLDCVADMQVVFGWDLTDAAGSEGQDGVIETYSTPVGTGGAITVNPGVNLTLVTAALADPEKLRNSLKIIKINILTQVGKSDRNYTSNTPIVVGDPGEASLTKTYNLPANMRNFRWKVYRLVVRPKNLTSNQ